jgi:hypothetical protein
MITTTTIATISHRVGFCIATPKFLSS